MQKVTIRKTDYYLEYNCTAMFEARALTTDDNLARAILPDTAEAFDITCKLAVILIQQGELVRRYMGYDHGSTPDADIMLAVLRPFEYLQLKNAALAAIAEGYGRTTGEDEEVDEGLLELQKKNGAGQLTMAQVLRMGAVSGLGTKETLLLQPGVLFDLFDYYLQANGLKKKEVD